MPIYEYKCKSCGATKELFQPISVPLFTMMCWCKPSRGKPMQRVYSTFGIVVE